MQTGNEANRINACKGSESDGTVCSGVSRAAAKDKTGEEKSCKVMTLLSLAAAW
jgi:hypothetical protein